MHRQDKNRAAVASHQGLLGELGGILAKGNLRADVRPAVGKEGAARGC